MKISAFVILLLALSACGGPSAQVTDSTVQGTQVRYDGSDSGLSKANNLARKKCGEYGRTAALLSSSKLDDSYVASYECKKGDN